MHICSKTYAPGKPARYLVLIDSKYYDVDDWVLRMLNAGIEPEALELEPVAEENTDDDQ